MKPIKWCEYCFEIAKTDEIPEDFTLVWETHHVTVYTCEYCGGYFICPPNNSAFYRTRKPIGRLLDYIRRAIDNDERNNYA